MLYHRKVLTEKPAGELHLSTLTSDIMRTTWFRIRLYLLSNKKTHNLLNASLWDYLERYGTFLQKLDSVWQTYKSCNLSSNRTCNSIYKTWRRFGLFFTKGVGGRQ
jgi:hypothetical protein